STQPRPAPHRCITTAAVSIQYSVDDPRTCQPARAIGWEISPARAERWQIPAHGCQPVKSSLDQEYLSLTGRAFEPENGFFTRESEIFDPHFLTRRVSAEEPDRLSTSQFGNDNPSGEPLAKHAAVFSGFGTAKQAEI